MINRPIRLDHRALASGESAAARYIETNPRVTLVERCLLFASIVALPLQHYFPPVAGMSSSFLLFAALLVYVIVNRSRILGTIWYQPVFIAAYAFFVVSVLLEFSSPFPDYQQPKRFLEMLVGMISVAALCRGRSALIAGLYGYIAIALWVSVLLYMMGYEALQGVDADNFHQASSARGQAFQEKPLGANINGLALVCVQGGLIAFALSLSDKWNRFRFPLLGIVGVCLSGSLLAMSRAAVVVILVGLAAILYARGFRQGKALILVSVLGMGIYAVVPDAVWSRMQFSTEVNSSGKMESRAKLYTNALNRLPEYIVAGVGAGNFKQKWALEKGFSAVRMSSDGKSTQISVHMAHNAFIQLTVYWGILGLSTFLLIIWCVYRSIPLQCGRDGLSLAMLGIIVSLGLYLLFSHEFAGKGFSNGVGMLIGARRWIWPRGIVPAVEENRFPSGADTNTGSGCHSR